MNRLLMVGFTHHRTPVGLLERVTVPRDERARMLDLLYGAGCAEAVLLSTCSRTEVYATPAAVGPEGLLAVLTQRVGVPMRASRAVVETRTGPAVVEHLFRVASGLDSRVMGEAEVQGQVQTAFRASHAAGMTGPVLGQLFPAALRCGREVREQTALGSRGRSLAHRAVEVGLESLGAEVDPIVLVVGSGHMASTAVKHLQSLGRRPHVVARNVGHAARLADPGLAFSLSDLAAKVARADLLICATSAQHHIVTVADVRAAMRNRSKPLTVVDLSVPRNVDASVASVPNVRLIDLESMNDDATQDPEVAEALVTGAAIVEAETRKYVEGAAARQAGPVIAALRRRVEETFLTGFEAVTVPMATDGEAMTRAARSTAARLLHRATIIARAAAVTGDTATLRLVCEIFDVRPTDAGVNQQDGHGQRGDQLQAVGDLLDLGPPEVTAVPVPLQRSLTPS